MNLLRKKSRRKVSLCTIDSDLYQYSTYMDIVVLSLFAYIQHLHHFATSDVESSKSVLILGIILFDVSNIFCFSSRCH